MPIYEYECRRCGHQFEYLVLSSTPAAACPACKKRDLKQLISLCATSSEATREANLSAAHKTSAAKRKEKQHAEHTSLHNHFEDARHGKGRGKGRG
jgi:putative FmdB family regulatory protein